MSVSANACPLLGDLIPGTYFTTQSSTLTALSATITTIISSNAKVTTVESLQPASTTYEVESATQSHEPAHRLPSINYRTATSHESKRVSASGASQTFFSMQSFITPYYADGEGHFFSPTFEVSPFCSNISSSVCTYANFTRFVNCTDTCYVIPTGESSLQQVYVTDDGRLSYSFEVPKGSITTGFRVILSRTKSRNELIYTKARWAYCQDWTIEFPDSQSFLFANVSGFNPDCSEDCICWPANLYIKGYCDQLGTCCLNNGTCAPALPDALRFPAPEVHPAHPWSSARLVKREISLDGHGYYRNTSSANATSSTCVSSINLSQPTPSSVAYPNLGGPYDRWHQQCYEWPYPDMSVVSIFTNSTHFYTDWLAVQGRFYASAEWSPSRGLCTSEDRNCGRCPRGEHTIFADCRDTCMVVS